MLSGNITEFVKPFQICLKQGHTDMGYVQYDLSQDGNRILDVDVTKIFTNWIQSRYSTSPVE